MTRHTNVCGTSMSSLLTVIVCACATETWLPRQTIYASSSDMLEEQMTSMPGKSLQAEAVPTAWDRLERLGCPCVIGQGPVTEHDPS